MMEQAKAAIASKTVWGGIIALLGPVAVPILDTIGMNVPSQWQPIVAGASSIVGGLLAIYGRVSATQQIVGVLKVK
jgi:hypothetical protein